MKTVLLDELNDETKLIRFVDKCGMKKSIGMKGVGQFQCSFPLQLLSYYRACEGIAADPNEGSTMIDLGDKGIGKVTTCNDALISCWSICDDLADPWMSLAGSSFANRADRPYVLVSSIGRVRTQVNKILNEINSEYSDEHGVLIMNAICGMVRYYPLKGVDRNEWETKSSSALGVDMPIILNIFYKSQRYDAEKECRFALIASARNFNDANGVPIDGNEMIKRFVHYLLPFSSQFHYIEKVLASSHSGGCNEIILDEIF